MFHLISKILYVFSTPIVWVFILIILGIVTKSAKRRKQFLYSGLLALYLFSNSFVFDEIVGMWEPEMNVISADKKYDLAIVLGGYATFAPLANQVNFGATSDRINSVLPLYENGQVKRILLSGGAGSLYDFNGAEAIYVGNYLKTIGIKSRHLILEPKSKNTYQNAVEAKRIIDSLQIENKVLLITSTTHMPRSSACFDMQNINYDEYRVDGLTGERKFYFDHLFIPNSEILFKWNIIFHEWLGLISYKIAGYI